MNKLKLRAGKWLAKGTQLVKDENDTSMQIPSFLVQIFFLLCYRVFGF